MVKVIAAAALVLVLASPLLVWWFAQRPVPSLDGVGRVSGLSRPVVVGFDSRCVPYIKAESEEDVYAAQGYVVARERMFQMDILRRSARGLISEVFGLEFLPTDRLVRTLGFERLAGAELEALSPGARQSLESYCRGVNAYLEEFRDRPPLEFSILGVRPARWTPLDSLAIMKYMQYELDDSWKLDDLRWRATTRIGDRLAGQLFRDDFAYSSWSPDAKGQVSKPAGAVRVSEKLSRDLAVLARSCRTRATSPLWGSTAWVVSGRSARAGLPLLAADKHGGFTAPCDWFLCSLSAPGIHVAGGCLPGVPGVYVGRNDHVAWSGSSLRADVQDLFAEHFDSELGSEYKTPKGNEKALDLAEVIPVRFGKSVEHRVTLTRHGPVLARDAETAVALSWTGFDSKQVPVLNWLYEVNHCGTGDEFVRVLANYSGSPQLFVYCDSAGKIGCHAAGRIPVRSGGAAGTTMSEGWLGRGEWTSYLSFDQLPGLNIPPGATRQAGNYCIAAGQKIASGHLLGHQWTPPYRANRLAFSLRGGQADTKHELLDMSALQSDHFGMLTRLVTEQLKKASVNTKSIEAAQSQALELMQGWDGMVAANSAPATVYESFMTTLARRLVEPKLGPDLTRQYLERWPLWTTFVEHYLREKPDEWLPPEERTVDTFLITTFAKANTRLKLFFNNEDVSSWQWRQIHQATFRHMITNGLPWLAPVFSHVKVGLAGDADTIDACDFSPAAKTGLFESRHGPTLRLLIDMSDPDKFYAGITLGQSGHLLSPYFGDQMAPWARCDTLPLAFSASQVDKQVRSRLYLSGAGGD